jgi:hypothetical protein
VPRRKGGKYKNIKDKRQKSSSCVKIRDDLILAQSCGIVPRKKGGKYKKYKKDKSLLIA